jgi:hypothetical protein
VHAPRSGSRSQATALDPGFGVLRKPRDLLQFSGVFLWIDGDMPRLADRAGNWVEVFAGSMCVGAVGESFSR